MVSQPAGVGANRANRANGANGGKKNVRRSLSARGARTEPKGNLR